MLIMGHILAKRQDTDSIKIKIGLNQNLSVHNYKDTIMALETE